MIEGLFTNGCSKGEGNGAMHYGLFINGRWCETDGVIRVADKFTGETLATVNMACREDVLEAVQVAKRAAAAGPLPPQERYKILLKTAALIDERAEEFAFIISREAGKPIRDARAEVDRSVETLTLSAEEAKRIAGDGVPIEACPGAHGRMAFTMRVPVGVVGCITPFNFPLNLVLHKVAPALAAGNAVVHKPAENTPLSSAKLACCLAEAGLPGGYYNLLFGEGETVGQWLLEAEGVDFYTFTGSPAVGRLVKAQTGLRPVTLELGNNSAVLVHRDADLGHAVPLCVSRSFGYAGQVCISVQRIYLHQDIFEPFCQAFLPGVSALRVGDPTDEQTDVGPMISEREVARAESWVAEAVASGARLLAGGRREGTLMVPTVLTDTDRHMKVITEEVFAPVVSLIPYESLTDAIEQINRTRYGLQAGVFTESIEVAMEVAKRVNVGGVMINDTSCFRGDLMPYGGVKESGFGREGPSYAVKEMTHLKLVVLNLKGAGTKEQDAPSDP